MATCHDCRYWRVPDAAEEDGVVANDNPSIGLCRRYPPVARSTPQGDTALFPVTHKDTWCGEWRTAEAPPAKPKN